ncbi:MAG: hypothetical protein FWH21_07720 [Kiritimatiellaeota bacterium]|nr:hypothetical protein [Kiritimatiellota bacterium]
MYVPECWRVGQAPRMKAAEAEAPDRALYWDRRTASTVNFCGNTPGHL